MEEAACWIDLDAGELDLVDEETEYRDRCARYMEHVPQQELT